MPDISFITPDGDVVGFEAPAGISLMRAATGHGIDGIIAECGGQARCATCHVIVDEEWVTRLAPPSVEELEMLEYTAVPRQPNSRLSCQIRLTDEMQGLVVRLPDAQ